MSNALLWSIIGIVVGGFVFKQILEWFNQGRFKPLIDLVVSITVFIAVSTLIVQGINAAKQVMDSIPK